MDISKIKEALLDWLPKKMASIGADKAVLGISGGKDSSVMAALLAQALGRNNVYGVLIPQNSKTDTSLAEELCQTLGINCQIISIEESFKSIKKEIELSGLEMSGQAQINLPARLRMSVLYAYAQTLGSGAVINTSNLSEDWIGYVTVFGDSAGAFSPFGMLTATEVVLLGEALGLDEKFTKIPPADGLREGTDEDVFGFTYKTLDTYIRTGEIEDEEDREKIDRLHKRSRFKFQTMDLFNPGLEIKAQEIGDFYPKESKENI